MSLLPKTTSDFGQSEYWNSFFKKRGKEAFEWYGEYPELCGILHKYIKPQNKILVIGCGNSTLSSDLYDVGYKNIINIDVSGVAIKQMKSKSVGKEGLEYIQMDATNTTFKDGEFNVVLDKGTLDALMTDSSIETVERIDKLFNEIDRVLSPLGRYVCVSLLQEHILKHLAHHFSSIGWMLRVCRCEDAERSSSDGGFTFPVFIVICTKLKKVPDASPVLELCYQEKAKRKSSVEALMVSVKQIQNTSLVCSGLNRCSIAGAGEVTIELMQPENSLPRFTVIVADSPKAKDTNNMKFGAFIVPQGRETEWLFGSPEGRLSLVEDSGFDRLAVIHLHREHKYESLQAVQNEMAWTVVQLAPNTKKTGSKPKIPFLSVGNDLGNVKEIARGKSAISGDYIVEDAEGENKQIFRRLMFCSNQNVVQSEAKLRTVKTKGKTRQIIDSSHLACEHHMYLTMGVSMVEQDHKSVDILVIGLGAGSLCTYIRKCFPNVKMTVVDIDPVILDIAKEHFNFQEDANLKVVIEDGVNYLKNTAKTGTKFSAILFDVDSKDTSLGLSCPPTSFLESEILSATTDCLTDTGVCVMNFVCRVESLRQETVTKMSAAFSDICSVKLKQEVNEIFFCWKSKKKMSIESAVDKLNNTVKNQKIQKLDVINKKEILSMKRVFPPEDYKRLKSF